MFLETDELLSGLFRRLICNDIEEEVEVEVEVEEMIVKKRITTADCHSKKKYISSTDKQVVSSSSSSSSSSSIIIPEANNIDIDKEKMPVSLLDLDKVEKVKYSNRIDGGEATLIGPPEQPSSGNLLENNELVWCIDEWDEKRVKEAMAHIKNTHGNNLSEFKRNKLEREASKNWDMFYKRNKDNFYKNRNYLMREFPEFIPLDDTGSPIMINHKYSTGNNNNNNPVILDDNNNPMKIISDDKMSRKPLCNGKQKIMIEAGCGVGNTCFPVLDINPDYFVYALDFAQSAIDIIRKLPEYQVTNRCRTWVMDLVNDEFSDEIMMNSMGNGGVDIIMLMFCLSAINPSKFFMVISKLHNILKPGGRILFRDYGRYDVAQLRFKKGHKIDDNFYMRQDGTRVYYFTVEDLHELFVNKCGFIEIENHYIRRQYANRGEQEVRCRNWIQARFEKPII